MSDRGHALELGFTGTQAGMSDRQKDLLRRRLLIYGQIYRATAGNADRRLVLHHGDCIGADVDADAVAREAGWEVEIHPPDDDSKRAFCAQAGDTVRQPLPYLERNHDIVDVTLRLIAAPRQAREEIRSGTWATVRYARRVGHPVTVLPR